jgi:hypothetical protein
VGRKEALEKARKKKAVWSGGKPNQASKLNLNRSTQ